MQRAKKRGFVLVEFDEQVKSVEFIEIPNVSYEIIQVDANNRKAESVNAELMEKTKEVDPANKVVIIKVKGELTSGKTADVDISSIRDELNSRNAMVINISKNALTSKEYSITKASGENKEEIETNVFSENIGQLRLEYPQLLDEHGVALAKKLLGALGQPALDNEKQIQYIPRIRDNALALLGLDDDDS